MLLKPIEIDISSTYAIFDCTLPCSSSMQCGLFNISTSGAYDKNISNTTKLIFDPISPYDYPIQRINISNLMRDTMYRYCFDVFDDTIPVGMPECGNFKTTGMYWYTVHAYVHM